ncbi:CvpA family protein [Algiphilus sp.]|uniref:CvpA family protein n=1 Tax=Algiphilus sp. TaxID=1872431 RepID=UPI003C5F08BF
MNWVDYCVIAIVLVSALVGLLRGFVREALNLASWVLAVVASILFAPTLDAMLVDTIGLDPARMIIAYLAVFILALIIGSVATHFIASAVRGSPFSGPDRALGGLFGGARGVLMVVIAVAVGGMTVIERESWWQDSALVPRFEPLAEWTRAQLPSEWVRDIAPDPEPEPEAASTAE